MTKVYTLYKNDMLILCTISISKIQFGHSIHTIAIPVCNSHDSYFTLLFYMSKCAIATYFIAVVSYVEMDYNLENSG